MRGMLGIVGGSRFCDIECERELTVRKTSTFFHGDGFVVYEKRRSVFHQHHRPKEEEEESGACGGVLVFRVERYGGAHHRMMKSSASTDDLVLMGPEGECILTVKRKLPSLHQRWEGFAEADVEDSFNSNCNLPPVQKNKMTTTKKKKKSKPFPIFSVRRSSIVGSKSSLLVEVYSGNHTSDNDDDVGQTYPEHPTFVGYHVEGSFSQRCCAIYSDDQRENDIDGADRRKLVEIGRKVDGSTNVTLGKDVFSLRLCPGFDAAFAMGIVLALDQISADDGAVDGEDNTL